MQDAEFRKEVNSLSKCVATALVSGKDAESLLGESGLEETDCPQIADLCSG